jgi:predicted Rossmann fold flavoprotein
VVATGGLSIPKMGASPWGYRVAEQFGIATIPMRAGLVPFTLTDQSFDALKALSGVSLEVEVCCENASFREAMLLTHRGLSGPAILQISSYWREGKAVTINLLPTIDAYEQLVQMRTQRGSIDIAIILSTFLPKRFAHYFCDAYGYSGRVGEYSNKRLQELASLLHNWSILPNGTEGYRTAEVTLGGVDTCELSSKTLEAKKVPGLYFIGEVVDVTGHLGGFNFQWAWSSAYAAGISV